MLVEGEGIGERTDGPLHDGGNIIDSRYDNGAWDTLSVSGKGMTLVGWAPDGIKVERDDGSYQPLQPLLFLMVRNQQGYCMTVGGGA